MQPAPQASANVRQVVPFFRVSEMGRSIRFYSEALGFSMKHQWVVDGNLRWCWLAFGGASLMPARQAFEQVFKAVVSVLERSLAQNGQPRRTTAHATAALCVGGMVVARAVADRRLADNLRDACMTVALKLGGWATKKRSANGSTKKFPRARPTAAH